jgi:hypothetical protein
MIPQIFICTRGEITVMAHEAGCNLKIESQSDVYLLRL